MRALLVSRWTKIALFLLCLVPLGALLWRFFSGRLGANPVEFVQHATGDWTLRFLVFTLCITPLRKLLKDVAKRPFITVGFTAFVLLIPLAITSTAGWIRRLGGRRWQMLHRAIYVSAVCGVIHYYWLVKSAVIRPLTYGAIVGLLLAWRFGDWFIRRGRPVAVSAGSRPASVNG